MTFSESQHCCVVLLWGSLGVLCCGRKLTGVEPSKRAQDKEHIRICRRIIDSRRDVRNSDSLRGTGVYIDLIVSSTYSPSAQHPNTPTPPSPSTTRQNPLPLWHKNFQFLGNTATSSSSINPVIATLMNVLYAATTLSNAPDLHSSINSARDRALGSITFAIEAMESCHSLCAL